MMNLRRTAGRKFALNVSIGLEGSLCLRGACPVQVLGQAADHEDLLSLCQSQS